MCRGRSTVETKDLKDTSVDKRGVCYGSSGGVTARVGPSSHGWLRGLWVMRSRVGYSAGCRAGLDRIVKWSLKVASGRTRGTGMRSGTFHVMGSCGQWVGHP